MGGKLYQIYRTKHDASLSLSLSLFSTNFSLFFSVDLKSPHTYAALSPHHRHTQYLISITSSIHALSNSTEPISIYLSSLNLAK
ncbi:hypothetical protein LguiA_006039 [Lonicera macranthoides]